MAEGDTLLQQSIETLMNLAGQMIIQPYIQYKPEGTDFLSKCRDCLAKVMTLSMAYWLFGVLSDGDKETIRIALIEKGLRAGLEIYPEGFAKKINN